MANRGFSLVELLVVIAIIGVIAALAIPNLVQARRASNESSAIANLKAIGNAEATYLAQKGTYASFPGLTGTSLLDSAFSDGCTRNQYVFDEVSITSTDFEFQSKPTVVNNGTRSFNIIGDYVIRQAFDPVTPPAGTSGTPIGAS